MWDREPATGNREVRKEEVKKKLCRLFFLLPGRLFPFSAPHFREDDENKVKGLVRSNGEHAGRAGPLHRDAGEGGERAQGFVQVITSPGPSSWQLSPQPAQLHSLQAQPPQPPGSGRHEYPDAPLPSARSWRQACVAGLQ